MEGHLKLRLDLITAPSEEKYKRGGDIFQGSRLEWGYRLGWGGIIRQRPPSLLVKKRGWRTCQKSNF